MTERTDNGGTPMLEVRDLTVHHGQLRALDRVSLRVFPGEVYAIIGANGAGKSTLLRTIAGLHQPTDGAILYDGKDMTRVRPERRATAGSAWCRRAAICSARSPWRRTSRSAPPTRARDRGRSSGVYELFAWMKDRRTQRDGPAVRR
jgi:ABC-type branched-chain amino acid transport systems, ATPase component